MTKLDPLRGITLRYVLTMTLRHNGHMPIADLIEKVHAQGFSIEGRPSKTVSDALRWEVRRGRVRLYDRGLYGPGEIPRSTEYRIHQRVLALRAQVRELSLEGGHETTCPPPVTDVA